MLRLHELSACVQNTAVARPEGAEIGPWSNLNQSIASNIVVSGFTKARLFAIVAALIAISSALNASPIAPAVNQPANTAERPKTMFIPAYAGWSSAAAPASNFNLTFERYGPQATARAVRASLWAALTPDPLAMAALLFCAFALRWMRMSRRERIGKANSELSSSEVALSKTA